MDICCLRRWRTWFLANHHYVLDSLPVFPFKRLCNEQKIGQVHCSEIFAPKLQEKIRMSNISLPYAHIAQNLFRQPPRSYQDPGFFEIKVNMFH